jgi:hypothetical protein
VSSAKLLHGGSCAFDFNDVFRNVIGLRKNHQMASVLSLVMRAEPTKSIAYFKEDCMNKRGRGKRGGRGQGAHRAGPEAAPAAHLDNPIVLSITPEGASVPGGSGESAEIRRQLEQHARDVEEYVRAQRFNAIVNRVLADVERRDPTAPVLRLRK